MKTKFKSRTLTLAAILLAGLTALTSCAAESKGDTVSNSSPRYDYAEDKVQEEAEAGGMDGSMAPTLSDGTSNESYERKVIRTVKMSCETKAYEDATSAILSALTAHGGYVETSSSTGTGYDDVKGSERYATYTFRVPAQHLDAFLETLRQDEGIRILSQDANSNEITASYYDTVSRLETLNAEKASLTAMLEGFTDYSDISAMLQVQERLYNVIEEIEALQTCLNLYDGQVAMSTVHLTLREVITYTEVVEPDPTFGQRISEAFKDSWTDFGEGCQDFAVWFVEAFPTLLVLAVIGGGIATVVIVLNRKAEKRRRASRMDHQPASSAPPANPYRTDNKK